MKLFSTKQQQHATQVTQVAESEDYILSPGEDILEVRVGLAAKAKNSNHSFATLRGTHPCGAVLENSESHALFIKLALSSFVYEKSPGHKKSTLQFDEEGKPKTGLVNGVLRRYSQPKLSPQAQEVYQYLQTGGLVPVDPKSQQAEMLLASNPEALNALKELREGIGENRFPLNSRGEWLQFRKLFFGGGYPVFFSNPEEGDELARELEQIEDDLKSHSIVIGYRLRREGQPCWTERDEAALTKGKNKDAVYFPGTDEAVKTRPVNVDIAYLRIEGHYRTVDPASTMNTSFYEKQMNLMFQFKSPDSEGIGEAVIQERLEKWESLMATLRAEAGGKKKVKARKDQIRQLAVSADPEDLEEVRETLKEVRKIAEEGSSPHWKVGGVDALEEEVKALNPDALEDEEDEDEEGVKALEDLDLEDEEEEEPVVETSKAALLAKLKGKR